MNFVHTAGPELALHFDPDFAAMRLQRHVVSLDMDLVVVGFVYAQDVRRDFVIGRTR